MTPRYFQVTSADMQPTLLKDDVIEGFNIKVRNMNFLKGVYVIKLNSRTLAEYAPVAKEVIISK